MNKNLLLRALTKVENSLGELAKNCGNGAGGFQPGNSCARGGGGGGKKLTTRTEAYHEIRGVAAKAGLKKTPGGTGDEDTKEFYGKPGKQADVEKALKEAGYKEADPGVFKRIPIPGTKHFVKEIHGEGGTHPSQVAVYQDDKETALLFHAKDIFKPKTKPPKESSGGFEKRDQTTASIRSKWGGEASRAAEGWTKVTKNKEALKIAKQATYAAERAEGVIKNGDHTNGPLIHLEAARYHQKVAKVHEAKEKKGKVEIRNAHGMAKLRHEGAARYHTKISDWLVGKTEEAPDRNYY